MKYSLPFYICLLFVLHIGCKNQEKQADKISKNDIPQTVIPFFEHWNLILGDGSNVGQATNYADQDFFFTSSDNHGDWVVFKTPNAGNTHGTSNNTRTELAQLKKWPAKTSAKMEAS